jgi:hypothetical protein
MSLPVRSETRSDRELLDNAILSLKKARAAIKKFEASETVRKDKLLHKPATLFKKRLKKIDNLAADVHELWSKRIEDIE